MATEIQGKAKKAKLDNKTLLHAAITLGIMVGFQFLPTPEPITRYGMMTVGIFIGLIYGWTVSPNNMVWPALMGMVVLGLTEFGNSSAVMIKSFGSDMVVLNIVSMLMIGALSEAGIAEWLVVKLITAKFAKGKPWTLTALLVVGPYVLGILINPMILAIFLLSLYGTMFKQAGYARGDKYAVMTSIGMVISLLLAGVIFPFKGSMLMFLPVITASTDVIFDHAKYMMMITPFSIATVLLYIPLMKLFGCNPSKMMNADISDVEAKYQYGLTSYQKAILIGIVAFVVGAIIISFTGGNEGVRLLIKKVGIYGWAMLVCGVMMIVRLDNKALVDPNIVGKHVSWGIIFVIASATTVSGAMTSEATGVSAFLSNLVGPVMASLSPLMFLIVVGLVTFLATNFFNNLATIYTMIAVASALFVQGLGFNMEIAGIVIAVFGIMGFYLPASSVFGALLYAQDYNTPKSLYLYGAISMLFFLICFVVILLPLSAIIY